MIKYKAVGFDYGGVIGGGPKVGKKFTMEICEALGIEKELYREEYFKMNYLINTGIIVSWREFWKLFLDKLNISPDKLEVVMKISDEASKSYIVMDKDILNIIDQLRKNGYKTGLLSNATIENGRLLRKAGLDSHFDVFFNSAEIGLQKPNPIFYQNFAKALGVEINELVFIDDAEINLIEAKGLGISTILYTNPSNLYKELQKRGIILN